MRADVGLDLAPRDDLMSKGGVARVTRSARCCRFRRSAGLCCSMFPPFVVHVANSSAFTPNGPMMGP